MNDPFFLTRQTANLMEDFAREINAGSALFILYGDAGVGKSRLLQELATSRLVDSRVHGIELKSGEQDGKSSEDRSAEIEKTFVRAQEGDTIIADHFEAALKKTRHQLFLSWSTDGADKKLNLIICSSTDGFNELLQLTAHYQVDAKSFQLMPFDGEEVEAFLEFHLFPNQAAGKLEVPSDTRKQITAAKGRVGNLIDIAEREGDQIQLTPITEAETIRQSNWIIASVLVVILLAVGVGWYLFSGPRDFDTVADVPTQPEVEDVVTVEQEPLSESELAYEPEAETVIESTVDEAVELETESAEEIEALAQAEVEADTDELTEAEPEVVAEVEGETEIVAEVEPEPMAEDETQVETQPEPGTVTESEALAEAPPEEVDEPEPDPEPESEPVETEPTIDVATLALPHRFERDLQVSLDWLDNRAARVGTVQILLKSHDGFDVNSYYGFIDNLEKRQVDISKLRIFKTLTANRIVYSVFYEEFDTRKAAADAIDSLPQALRDLSPIPRSVGGIWEEIQRLDAQN